MKTEKETFETIQNHAVFFDGAIDSRKETKP